MPEKSELDKSLSHVQYPNHANTEIYELFEPTFVKLDKQVSASVNSKREIVFSQKFLMHVTIFCLFSYKFELKCINN